jgi:magnesium-transporting ATPase (P-type)
MLRMILPRSRPAVFCVGSLVQVPGPTQRQHVQMYGFSSAKKMASVLVDRGDGTLRLYNKGASEWVLNASVSVYEADGSIVPLTEAKKAELLAVVTEMASRGLRTLVCFLLIELCCPLSLGCHQQYRLKN